MGKALDFILSEPWAIEPAALQTILSVAQRYNDSPEAVAAKLGRPLENTRSVEMRSGVAVIPVRGPIFRYANLFTEISGATSLEVLARDFGAAQSDRSVRATLLWLDGPGGTAAGIGEFAEMVNAADKPVFAYAGDYAASAHYWIGSAADQFFASPTAIIGSIGVRSAFRRTSDDEIEIVSSQSPMKGATPETKEGRAEIQRVIDDLADVFIGAVAKYRGVSAETVMSDFGRGGVLVGEKAVAAGMADEIGSLESVIAGLSGGTQEGFSMTTTAKADSPEITRVYLAENHSALVEDIKTEGFALGHQDGKKEGAKEERERIQAVMGQSMPGHEAMIQGLAFDGKTTGPEAAVAVLAAEKTSRAKALAEVKDGRPAAVPFAESPDAAEQDSFEDKLEAYQVAGLSRGQAMKKAANEHPALHKAWLARINTKKAAG